MVMLMRKFEKIDFSQKVCMLLLIIALLSIIILNFSKGISGNDFWWHVKIGEWIVENQEIPTTDIFSWYGVENRIPWTAHEWLSDVIFFYVHLNFGDIGIFLFSIIAALTLLALMFSQCIKEIKNNILVAGIFFALFSVVISSFFYGRPHVFSYFILFFELKILYEFLERKSSKKIFLIPLLAVLWSNLHGGSSNLSYILCLIFLFIGMLNFKYERITSDRFNKTSILKMVCVTLGSVMGIMINPVGFKVLAYPYISMSDFLSMSIISEWQAPDAKSIGELILYFLPILVLLISIICVKRNIRLVDLVVMFVFVFLFLRSVRFIVLWYIAAAFCSLRYVPESKVKKITKNIEKITIALTFGILLVLCCFRILEMTNTYKNGELIKKTMSHDAIEIIKRDDPKRIFNDYNLGEALIYNDIPVFFDSRADLFAQNNIMVDGISLSFLEPAGNSLGDSFVNVEELIEKYRFDAILILKGRPLFSYLMNNPKDFELVYDDNELGYFRVVRES